jgi:hypothetical protein
VSVQAVLETPPAQQPGSQRFDDWPKQALLTVELLHILKALLCLRKVWRVELCGTATIC